MSTSGAKRTEESADHHDASGTYRGRPIVKAKFLYLGDEKFWIKGTAYGAFAPNRSGHQFPEPGMVDVDFTLMRGAGINTILTYTVPPISLLDQAQSHGLRAIITIPWMEYACFLESTATRRNIRRQVREAVASCRRHPAAMMFCVGKEIPPAIVRWHGSRKVERFLQELYDVAKQEDPDSLVTYTNFPTTEYLDLPFVDVYTANVYLHQRSQMCAYLSHLQHLAGELPLVLSEFGICSLRHGEQQQAEFADWQLEEAFDHGLAGAVVFGWTDPFYQDHCLVTDWGFGLVDAQRRPKPVYTAVARQFAGLPFARDRQWPSVSVVVAAHNAGRTLDACLQSLKRLRYPDYEVIVVDDGSTDDTAAIMQRYAEFRGITTGNQGVSAARNEGLRVARGEIIAYIDSDAEADPDWLNYLVTTYLKFDVAGVGGPNIVPAEDGWVAKCVYRAPGGPTQVMLDDCYAEHIPGCNMSFRAAALNAIGGFDPRFRAAADDVDICWRLLDAGYAMGFSPSAVVWHHRRPSVKAYWRQQVGYGVSESILERKFPNKFNPWGHAFWAGRIYAPYPFFRLKQRSVIYQGLWGSAGFQPMYAAGHGGVLSFLPRAMEWHFALLVLLGLGTMTSRWALAAFAVGLAYTTCYCVVCASRARLDVFGGSALPFLIRLRSRAMIAWLNFLEPLARDWGRLKGGLTPWRAARLPRNECPAVTPWWRCLLPVRRVVRWTCPGGVPLDKYPFLTRLTDNLLAVGCAVGWNPDDQAWDLRARRGALATTELRMVVEHHGGPRRLGRFAATIQPVPILQWMIAGLTIGSFVAAGQPLAFGVLLASSLVLAVPVVRHANNMERVIIGVCNETVAALHATAGVTVPASRADTPSLLADALDLRDRGGMISRWLHAARARWRAEWRAGLMDAGLIVMAAIVALLLVGQFVPATRLFRMTAVSMLAGIPIKVMTFAVLSVHRRWSWRVLDADDFVHVLAASVVASTAFAITVTLTIGPVGPASWYAIDFLVTFAVMASAMPGIRNSVGIFRRHARQRGAGILIYGAGIAGRLLVRDIRNQHLPYDIVGFVDDDPNKQGAVFMGVPVIGTGRDLPTIIAERNRRAPTVRHVIVAIPSASTAQQRDVIECCRRAGVSCKTVPSLGDLISGKMTSAEIRDISAEELLGRPPVQLNEQVIADRVEGRSVLVTGAAGSIGSELCRELARFAPRQIVLCDQAESELFKLDLELGRTFPEVKCVPTVGDVRDRPTIADIIDTYSIDLLFHAAAYKHVPMMETHILEAVKNNVLGTWNVVQAAANRVSDVVIISTDKAVKPVSVMGATKRVAELLASSMPVPTGHWGTKFVSVRFGNVLGSNGSVIPIFQSQIAAGGPLTVTHPDVRRFFMTTREAVQLVLQASTMGVGSEIFVLDMGASVRIDDLARNLIRLCGFEPDRDIEVRYTGLRPGEKMYEELMTDVENVVATEHEKIKIFEGPRVSQETIASWIAKLERLITNRDTAAVIAHLARLVPEYQPAPPAVAHDPSLWKCAAVGSAV